MKSHESTENYLETILILSHSGAPVRSIDIVNALAYTKPSVSVAMKNLRENGYVEMNNDGHIALTESGRLIAESIYERHTLIADWLVHLGVDPETAAQDACRMEHAMSDKSFAAIRASINKSTRSSPLFCP